MLCQTKIEHYQTLDIKCLMDYRKFWKTVKLLFCDKIQAPSKIALLENEVLVTDDKEVAKIFSEYFVNITDSLGITQPEDPLQQMDGIYDSVEIPIKNYSSHPSVKLMSANNKPTNTFSINFVANNGVSARLRELKVKKASPIESHPE